MAFQSMTDSLLVFDIYAHVADITSTGGIKNELRFQIVERFHAEGIELASSSTDLVLGVTEIEKLSELMNKDAPRAAKARKEKPAESEKGEKPEHDDKV